MRTYRTPGTYTATVTVTDPQGKTASETVEIVVSERRERGAVGARRRRSHHRTRAADGASSARAATDPDGPEDEITYLWDFGDDGGAQFGRNVSHTYRTPGHVHGDGDGHRPPTARSTRPR